MLEGLTPVLTAFFLFCLYRKDLIRNRTCYYITFACLLGLILFQTMYFFVEGTYMQGFCAIMIGLLQAGALIMTMAYFGGMSLRQIGSEVIEAAHDVRGTAEARNPAASPSPSPAAEPPAANAPVPREAAAPEQPRQDRPRVVIELPKKSDDKGTLPID